MEIVSLEIIQTSLRRSQLSEQLFIYEFLNELLWKKMQFIAINDRSLKMNYKLSDLRTI